MQGPSAMPLKHDQRKVWEKFYRTQERPWKGYKEIDSFLELVKKGSLVLDAGSGTGKSSIKYYKDFKIILLDFSMNSLKNSVLKNEKILGNVKSLPFKDQVFDAIISIHLFEHLLEDERYIAMKELIRVLKEKGLLFIESFSVQDFRYGKGKEIEKNTFLRGNNIFTHYFEKDEFFNLLNNFYIIKMDESIIKRKILKNTYKMVNFVAIGIKI